MSVNGFTLDNGATIEQYDYEALDNIPTLAEAAQPIIETYAGSTLAGSAQSVKAAVDTLDAKVDRVTYINSFAGDTINDYITNLCTDINSKFTDNDIEILYHGSWTNHWYAHGIIYKNSSTRFYGTLFVGSDAGYRFELNSGTLTVTVPPTRSEVDNIGGATNALLDGTDLNTVMTPGNYVANNLCTNGPYSGRWYFLKVSKQVSGVVTRYAQEAYLMSSTASGYSYRIYDNGAWLQWEKVPTRAEFDALAARVTALENA